MSDSARSFVRRLLRRHEVGLLLAIFVVLALTSLLDAQHNYLRQPGESLRDIVRQTSLLGTFALGAAIVIVAGGIDLSAGSVIAFGGTVCATLMLLLAPQESMSNQPVGPWVIAAAIAGTLLTGFLIGSLHAWLITVVELPPFVATLATLVGLRSLGRALCETVTEAKFGGRGTQIQVYDESFRYLATSVWIPALLFLALAAAAWLLLTRTVTGRHLYALGGNEQAARLSGIRTDRLKWLAYCLSAMLSSLAGILYVGDQSVADPQTLGRGYELNAIAAAVVGGCSLQGGAGTIPGTVLGAVFLRIVIDGVAKIIKTGADVYEGLIVGVVVTFAVAFSQREGTVRAKRFFAGPLGLVAAVDLALLAGALAAFFGPTLLAGRTVLDAGLLASLATVSVLAFLCVVRSGLATPLRRIAAVVVLAVSALAAVGVDRQLPAWRASRAVAEIAALGGKVDAVADGSRVDLSGIDLDDRRLQELAPRLTQLGDLVELRLGENSRLTNDGLKGLEKIATLRRLDVTATQITRPGTRRLGRALPELETTP